LPRFDPSDPRGLGDWAAQSGGNEPGREPTRRKTMRYKQNLRIDGNKVISYTTHVATIDSANRKLLVHGYWSQTTSKHVKHVASEYGLELVKDAPKQTTDEPSSGTLDMMKTVSMVCAMGAVLGMDQKGRNDWNARMLKAGLGNRGLTMPENWDQLSEDEKEKRLTAALGAIA